jgi:acyl-CoA thioesterase FadM
MQETSHHHLREAGMSLDELRDKRGLAFILSRISIAFYAPLHADDKIDVQTWVLESRGLSFLRCFRILRANEVIAEAHSVWALLDIQQKQLLPITAFPYDIEPDEPLDAKLSARLRIPPLSAMESVGLRHIVYSDVDYNGHMNNTHYPDMLCDFTDGITSREVTGFSLSYLQEAAYGRNLSVYRSDMGEEHFFRTVDEEGNTCLEAKLFTKPIEDPK